MTEKTMKRLAAEARERHRNDPAWNPPLSESDKFWRDWSGWMKKRGNTEVEQDLFYHGKNDPTASTAIGNVMKGGRL